MKKNFILGVFLIGLFAISLVSAGWFSDLFNRPPSITGNAINAYPIDLNLDTLSNGLSLSKGWNYWFIWKDSQTSVSDVMSNIDKSYYYYVYEYNTNTRKASYWYGDSDKRNQFEKFSNGNQYAFYMRKAGVLKMENSDNFHSADYDRDGKINGIELSRLIVLTNDNGYYCNSSTVDGYSLSLGNRNCSQHDADINKNWIISKEEFSKVQFLYECRTTNPQVRIGEYKKVEDSFYQADQCNKNYFCSYGQKIGDLNNDGNINEYDYELSLRALAGEIQFSNKCCLDVNLDGQHSVGDSIKLVRILQGYESSPGVCGQGDTQVIVGGSSNSSNLIFGTDENLQESQRYHPTDTDRNFKISMLEFSAYKNRMIAEGSSQEPEVVRTIYNLFDVIIYGSDGTYHWDRNVGNWLPGNSAE